MLQQVSNISLTVNVLQALTCYEYITSLDKEILCVWMRPFSGSSAMLVSIHWNMVANQIVELISQQPPMCKFQCKLDKLIKISLIADIKFTQMSILFYTC